MKAITVNVSEPVYKDFQKFATERDRTTSELIREAMEEYRQTRIRPQPSLRDMRPASVGAILKDPLGREDDLLEEMIDA